MNFPNQSNGICNGLPMLNNNFVQLPQDLSNQPAYDTRLVQGEWSTNAYSQHPGFHPAFRQDQGPQWPQGNVQMNVPFYPGPPPGSFPQPQFQSGQPVNHIGTQNRLFLHHTFEYLPNHIAQGPECQKFNLFPHPAFQQCSCNRMPIQGFFPYQHQGTQMIPTSAIPGPDSVLTQNLEPQQGPLCCSSALISTPPAPRSSPDFGQEVLRQDHLLPTSSSAATSTQGTSALRSLLLSPTPPQQHKMLSFQHTSIPECKNEEIKFKDEEEEDKKRKMLKRQRITSFSSSSEPDVMIRPETSGNCTERSSTDDIFEDEKSNIDSFNKSFSTSSSVSPHEDHENDIIWLDNIGNTLVPNPMVKLAEMKVEMKIDLDHYKTAALIPQHSSNSQLPLFSPSQDNISMNPSSSNHSTEPHNLRTAMIDLLQSQPSPNQGIHLSDPILPVQTPLLSNVKKPRFCSRCLVHETYSFKKNHLPCPYGRCSCIGCLNILERNRKIKDARHLKKRMTIMTTDILKNSNIR